MTCHICFDSTFSLKQLSGKNKALFSPGAPVTDLEGWCLSSAFGQGTCLWGRVRCQGAWLQLDSPHLERIASLRRDSFPLLEMNGLLMYWCALWAPCNFSCLPLIFVLCPPVSSTTCLSRVLNIFSVRLCVGAKMRYSSSTMYVGPFSLSPLESMGRSSS